MPSLANGYGISKCCAPAAPYQFERRDPRPNDVVIDILYSGVCHSDLHQIRNDWGGSKYPMVPGHEIVGRVVKVGTQVDKFSVGDLAAVGVKVDSCLKCRYCRKGEEQFCVEKAVSTYNNFDKIDGSVTMGGYSDHIVVRQEFCLQVPSNLDLARVPPLLCAGITTYSPLRKWGAGPGKRVAVTGLGGLGHMAVKLASALGAEVTVISRNDKKKNDALEMGAHHFLTNDEASQSTELFDIIIDTIPVKHQPADYLKLLDVDGAVVVVGHMGSVDGYINSSTVFKRHVLTGSVIGGIRETQEMLDFCGRANVLPDCETIKMEEINEALERLDRGDVKYRFVIDMKSSNLN